MNNLSVFVIRAFPPIGPRFDFPGVQILILLLDVFLAIGIIVLIMLFVRGVIGAVAAFGGNGKGMSGSALVVLMSLVGIVLLSTAGVFINGWTSFLGG